MDSQISVEQKKVLRAVTLGAVAVTLWFFTSTGTPRTVFAMRFGASDWQIGLLNSLPQLIGALQFFFVRWVQRYGKKRVLFPCLALSGVILAGQALAPLVSERAGDAAAVWMLIAVVSLASLAWTPGHTAWFPLLNDCVPEHIRGRYFARMRTWWLGATVLSMGIVMLWLGAGTEAPHSRYQILFAQSPLWAFLVIVAYWNLPESKDERATSYLPRRQVWSAIVRDRSYLVFVAGHAIACSLWMTLLVFSAAYMKRGLGYPDWLIIFSYPFAWALGSVASLWLWGRIVDHAGNRSVFMLTLTGLSLVACGWALTTGNSAAAKVWVGAISVLGGVAWSGYFMADTRQSLLMAPRDNQTAYLVLWTTSRGIGFAVGPFVAGLLLDALDRRAWLPVNPGTLHLNRYTLCFFFVALGFGVAALVLRRLQTAGEMATRRLATVAIARLTSWR